VDARWQLVHDEQSRLRLRRKLRTKNFVKVGRRRARGLGASRCTHVR
jgi:hypothetical protein